MGLRDRFRQWMIGRYGRDQLNTFLSILIIVLLVINMFVGKSILLIISLLLLVLLYFRTFSRDIYKRSEENRKFLSIKDKIFGGASRKRYQSRDSEHAYFKCPKCRKTLRVPRGRGKIKIHCPQCGTDFIERT